MSERRVVKKTKAAASVLVVKDGAVEINVVPQEEIEVAQPEADPGKPDEKPRITFSTPQGEAVYVYAGDCGDCLNKRPSVTTNVFVCTSGNVRADNQLGPQLAAFRRDGHHSTPLCQDCYSSWLGKQPQTEIKFKVLPR